MTETTKGKLPFKVLRGSKNPCRDEHDFRVHNHKFENGYCVRCEVKF